MRRQKLRDPIKRIGTHVTGKFLESLNKSGFVGSVDDITFGISETGGVFDTSNPKWEINEKIRWFNYQAELFKDIASKLERFAKALEFVKPQLEKENATSKN